MAYADVISLKHTIQSLLHSEVGNEVPAAESKLYIILHDVVESLQEVLEIVHNPKDEELKAKTWDLVEPLMLKRFPLLYSAMRFTRVDDVPSLTEFLVHTRVPLDCSDGRIGEAVSSLAALLESLLLLSKQENFKQFAGELDRAKLKIQSFQETVNTINHEEKMKDAKKRKKKNKSSVLGMDPELKKKLERRMDPELKKSLDHGMNLLQTWCSKKSLNLEYPQTMKLLSGIQEYGNKVLKNLEVGIRRLDMSRSNTSREILDALELKISETVHELEDLLETSISSTELLNPQTEENASLQHGRLLLSKMNQPDELQNYILPFTELVNKLKMEYITELINPSPEEEEEADDNINDSSSPKIYFHKNKSKMVGFHENVAEIKKKVISPTYKNERTIISLSGMAGIGKTTIAKEVFGDQSVSGCFELGAWVDVGRNYQIQKIMQSIVSQVGSNSDITEGEGGRLILEECLRRCLVGRRYLIVMDDVWDESARNDIERLFPDDKNDSRVLLTTRLYKVSQPTPWTIGYEMRFLDEEESWDLLRDKVFRNVQSPCPPLLVNAGKKIAKSCEGLPLTIVTIGDLLSKAEKTPEHWDKVAANPNPLLEEAYDQMLKVLLPSYNCLPQHLKACFLYMGIFPQNHQIHRSEIIKLWAAERLFDKKVDRPQVFRTTLDLFHNNILIPGICSSSLGRKTWRLHSAFWHLCRSISSNNKFFHIIRSYSDGISESIKGQRRLCIHKNILFGIEEVKNSMSSISAARSLLCTGPPHQYPVPICWDLSLLRVLNALTIRLYEFPIEVVKLVGLKYLALTCHENLPPSISKLRKIQFLIVRRHLSIVSSPSYYLPNEIWDMEESKHLQVMGSNLPDPCGSGSLPNLETLLDVGAQSCTSVILKGLPKLNKLGIRIELSPNDVEPLRCFDHIPHLRNLKELKCVVVNPTFGSHIVPPPLPIFPSSLERLSLSGLGYPWEDMRLIALLPNLTTLKLRCYAFRGPKWEIQDNGFPKLDFIQIEDSDLVHWTAGRKSMPKIFRIFLNSCYKLEKFPSVYSNVSLIGLLNCNPLAFTSAQQSHRFVTPGADLFSSYDDCLLHPKYVRTEIDEVSELSFNFFP